MHACMYNNYYVYGIEFMRRGFMHASNFATLLSHNFICERDMKFSMIVYAIYQI